MEMQGKFESYQNSIRNPKMEQMEKSCMGRRRAKAAATWALIGIVVAIVIATTTTAICYAIADNSYYEFTMWFTEDNNDNVVLIDPESGMITVGLCLETGTDYTVYNIYYKRKTESNYTLGKTKTVLVGNYYGPYDLKDQIAWYRWNIKVEQTNFYQLQTSKASVVIGVE